MLRVNNAVKRECGERHQGRRNIDAHQLTEGREYVCKCMFINIGLKTGGETRSHQSLNTYTRMHTQNHAHARVYTHMPVQRSMERDGLI